MVSITLARLEFYLGKKLPFLSQVHPSLITCAVSQCPSCHDKVSTFWQVIVFWEAQSESLVADICKSLELSEYLPGGASAFWVESCGTVFISLTGNIDKETTDRGGSVLHVFVCLTSCCKFLRRC